MLQQYETVEYQGILFAGATNWTLCQNEKDNKFLNHQTKFNLVAMQNLEKQAFTQLELVDIIITHIPPTKINSHSFFESTDGLLNPIPANSAKVFIFGHCHEQHIYEKDNSIYYINALGYPHEKSPQKIRTFKIIV